MSRIACAFRSRATTWYALTICWHVKAVGAALTFPVRSQLYSCNTLTTIVERLVVPDPSPPTIRDNRKNLSIERPGRFVSHLFSLDSRPGRAIIVRFWLGNERRLRLILESAAASTLLCKPLDQKGGLINHDRDIRVCRGAQDQQLISCATRAPARAHSYPADSRLAGDASPDHVDPGLVARDSAIQFPRISEYSLALDGLIDDRASVGD